MKKIITICMAALMLSACAGCKKTADKAASKTDSAVSSVKSGAKSTVDDIREGATDAASAVVSHADDMFENGQISDGDGIIGNEDEETEPSSEPGDITEAEDETFMDGIM